jgi:HAD superfamily hydrolase (TIGR01509 family)
MPRPAALFDLDGVISDTASVHAKAWRIAFDQALGRLGQTGRPFDEKIDYFLHVDGKMRQVGIEDFLASRGIVLPLGNASQNGLDTVNGIGNTKNAIFRDLIARDGVKIFEDALRLIDRLRRAGFELGIASSSKNARAVLERTGLLTHFGVIMDGLVAEKERVKSKPSPQFYQHAAVLFSRPPGECIVIEDALSGIASAKQAGIKLVVGIARSDDGAALRESGADIVVGSLDDVTVEQLVRALASELTHK